MKRIAVFLSALVPAFCEASVESWLDACERELDCVHGFVLMQHGKVVAEGSWKPFDTLNEPHMLYSHSKSFTSTAIGFLVDDGKIDLDERVIDILPDKSPDNPSDNLKALRIRDLLTMNTGASRTDAERDDDAGDWERALLANAFDTKPGLSFRYDSGATYLLAAVVERKSGKRLMDFLAERLFGPLGIRKAWSTTSPSGTACGGWGMNMTTRELALFGQLYLQKGMWNGKRLLSEEWVALATARQTWSGVISVAGEDGSDWHQGYGYQFWRCCHGFYRADGANGQLTIVMPQYDAVLSVHAGLSDMQKELDLVWEHVVPALEGGAVCGEDVAKRCAALALSAVAGTRDGADRYCGKVIPLGDNRKGISSMRLEPDGDGWRCILATAAGESSVSVGFGTWRKGTAVLSAARYEPLGEIVGTQVTAASGALSQDGSFRLRILFLNAPHKIDIWLRETDGVVTASGRFEGIGGCEFN